jgi:tetratricopeptide (TPR) repeat protein
LHKLLTSILIKIIIPQKNTTHKVTLRQDSNDIYAGVAMEYRPSKVTLRLIELCGQTGRRIISPAERIQRRGPISDDCVDPAELYGRVLNDRQQYGEIRQALYREGFEDPFEKNSAVLEYGRLLLERHRPATDLDKATLIFRAVLPSRASFNLHGQVWHGLNRSAGGLEILHSEDVNAGIRLRRRASLLPKDLVAEITDMTMYRVALCREYSFLLISLLQAGGISAYLQQVSLYHVNVIARLGEDLYELEALRPSFTLLTAPPAPFADDRQAVAIHYQGKGEAQRQQAHLDEALTSFNIALEIDPTQAGSWNNLGLLHMQQKSPAEAIAMLKHAISLNSQEATIWCNLGAAYAQAKQSDAARSAFEKVLELDPTHEGVHRNLDILSGRNPLLERLFGRR